MQIFWVKQLQYTKSFFKYFKIILKNCCNHSNIIIIHFLSAEKTINAKKRDDEIHDGEIHDDEIHDGKTHDGETHDDEIHDGETHDDQIPDGETHNDEIPDAHNDEIHYGETHDDEIHNGNIHYANLQYDELYVGKENPHSAVIDDSLQMWEKILIRWIRDK